MTSMIDVVINYINNYLHLNRRQSDNKLRR